MAMVSSRTGSRSSQRKPRRRSRRSRLEARTAAVLALAVLFMARPHLAELVLAGLGIVLATVLAAALAGLVLYATGMARGKFRPPARVILGRHSIEFL